MPLIPVIQKVFTFQSGSIQIGSQWQRVTRNTSFTFQSGSIQIILAMIINLMLTALHSNLVLFK